MAESRHSREHSSDRRAFRQMKRLFILAGIIEAERSCTVRDATELFMQRANETVSERQIRRDLVLLADLGVLEETVGEIGGKVLFRYTFEGWPIAIH